MKSIPVVMNATHSHKSNTTVYVKGLPFSHFMYCALCNTDRINIHNTVLQNEGHEMCTRPDISILVNFDLLKTMG